MYLVSERGLSMKTQVSIIILSYNPSWEKMKYTLHSVVCQSDIVFEVIIADDGSREDCRENIEAFFRKMAWENYQFLKLEKNQGTVKNTVNALNHASGEYIYLISPGDFLYDKYVMRDFYAFAKKKKCDICFGNTCYYTPEKRTAVSVKGQPARISLYHRKISPIRRQLCVFCDSIAGPSFFRSREAALKYIRGFVNISKYVEDYSFACYAILDGQNIYHYDRKMLFYECETGISNSKNPVWQKRIRQDCVHILGFLKEKYPKNVVVDFMYFYKKSNNVWATRFYKVFRRPWLAFYAERFIALLLKACIFRHPWMAFNALINCWSPKHKSDNSHEVQLRLDEIFHTI